jgi:2,3-bisphosphoglycerate-dependent phosphoglycerate mutase
MIYMIRHCEATGQDPDAPLTEKGACQALAVANVLARADIAYIVSSPYVRALQTIQPFSTNCGIPVHTDGRLIERVLSGAPLPDWRDYLRSSFDNPDRALPGGESANEASMRGRAAIDNAVKSAAGRPVAIVTHGNLLALLLANLDGQDGYDLWERLSYPDIFQVSGRGTINRMWTSYARSGASSVWCPRK